MCNSMDENEPSRGSCAGVHKHEANRRGVQEEEVSAQQLVTTFSSPMHAAALLGTAADISALAAAGHEFEGRDNIGRTPCHLAAISGNVKNLQALVELGAHLEVQRLCAPFSLPFGGEERLTLRDHIALKVSHRCCVRCKDFVLHSLCNSDGRD